jgi:hypothetical protein
MLSPTTGLRAGPAPLSLVSLGRWTNIPAAAGNPRDVAGMDPLSLITPLTPTSSPCDQLRERTP